MQKRTYVIWDRGSLSSPFEADDDAAAVQRFVDSHEGQGAELYAVRLEKITDSKEQRAGGRK